MEESLSDYINKCRYCLQEPASLEFSAIDSESFQELTNLQVIHFEILLILDRETKR